MTDFESGAAGRCFSSGQREEPFRIDFGLPRHIGLRYPVQFRQLFIDIANIGWFVAFAALLLRRQEGSIGLDQEALRREAAGDLPQRIGILEGERSGESDIEAQLQGARGNLIGG